MSELESLAMQEPLERHLGRHAIDRLIMLSDGVFAIAITLAALELRIPERATLGAVIGSVGTNLLTYFMSFAVIASFWVSNRDLFARVQQVDRGLTGLVLASLCLTALIPTSVRTVVPSQGDLGGAFAFYALVMTLAGLANCCIWLWACLRTGMMAAGVPRSYRIRRTLESATLPLIFLLLVAFPSVASLEWIAAGSVILLGARRLGLGRWSERGVAEDNGTRK